MTTSSPVLLPTIHAGMVEEYSIGRFLLCASDLRLPPGRWPASIPTTMGNRQPFIFARFLPEGAGALYRQGNGNIVLEVESD